MANAMVLLANGGLIIPWLVSLGVFGGLWVLFLGAVSRDRQLSFGAAATPGILALALGNLGAWAGVEAVGSQLMAGGGDASVGYAMGALPDFVGLLSASGLFALAGLTLATRAALRSELGWADPRRWVLPALFALGCGVFVARVDPSAVPLGAAWMGAMTAAAVLGIWLAAAVDDPDTQRAGVATRFPVVILMFGSIVTAVGAWLTAAGLEAFLAAGAGSVEVSNVLIAHGAAVRETALSTGMLSVGFWMTASVVALWPSPRRSVVFAPGLRWGWVPLVALVVVTDLIQFAVSNRVIDQIGGAGLGAVGM